MFHFCGWSRPRNYFNSEIFPIYGIYIHCTMHTSATIMSSCSIKQWWLTILSERQASTCIMKQTHVRTVQVLVRPKKPPIYRIGWCLHFMPSVPEQDICSNEVSIFQNSGIPLCTRTCVTVNALIASRFTTMYIMYIHQPSDSSVARRYQQQCTHTI